MSKTIHTHEVKSIPAARGGVGLVVAVGCLLSYLFGLNLPMIGQGLYLLAPLGFFGGLGYFFASLFFPGARRGQVVVSLVGAVGLSLLASLPQAWIWWRHPPTVLKHTIDRVLTAPQGIDNQVWLVTFPQQSSAAFDRRLQLSGGSTWQSGLELGFDSDCGCQVVHPSPSPLKQSLIAHTLYTTATPSTQTVLSQPHLQLALQPTTSRSQVLSVGVFQGVDRTALLQMQLPIDVCANTLSLEGSVDNNTLSAGLPTKLCLFFTQNVWNKAYSRIWQTFSPRSQTTPSQVLETFLTAATKPPTPPPAE